MLPTLSAMTRDVSPSLAGCELSFVDRSRIDPERAAAQHQDYRNALHALGCKLIALPMLPDLPDAFVVDDIAELLNEVVFITRVEAITLRGKTSPFTSQLPL